MAAQPLWPAYLATYTFMLGQWASGVAVPLHVGLLGGSLAEAGAIAAVRFGLGAFFQLPFGAIADAWGTRRTLFVAIIGNALVNLVPLAAVSTGSVVPLYVWAVLSGLTASMFLPAISAYVAVSAPEGSRGSAFGWLTLCTHTGVASGPAIGGIVWQMGGPVPTYLLSAVLGVVAVIGPSFVARSMRTRVQLSRLPAMIGEVARQRPIVGSWLAALAIGLPWGAVAGLFPLFGISVGLAAGTVGLLLAVQSVANGASRVPLGRLIDRRRIPPVAAAGAALVYAAITALLGLQTGVPGIMLVLVTGIVALAFSLMMVQLTISAVARPELRATGLGGYGTALSAGLGIGPFIAGGVANVAGFGWGFGVIGLIGVGVAVVASLVLAGNE
ncbi:MAG: MFS transporter [Candidatus Limnocylindria bacterium]